jgi:hypothetical protein
MPHQLSPTSTTARSRIVRLCLVDAVCQLKVLEAVPVNPPFSYTDSREQNKLICSCFVCNECSEGPMYSHGRIDGHWRAGCVYTVTRATEASAV